MREIRAKVSTRVNFLKSIQAGNWVNLIPGGNWVNLIPGRIVASNRWSQQCSDHRKESQNNRSIPGGMPAEFRDNKFIGCRDQGMFNASL